MLDVHIRRVLLVVIIGLLGLGAVAGVAMQSSDDLRLTGGDDLGDNPFDDVDEAPHDLALDITFPLPAGVEDARYEPDSFHEEPARFGGDRGTRLHAPFGTPVFAMAPGVVSSANHERGRVAIRSSQEGRYSYDNLAGLAPDIASGQTVRRGQLVGWIGCSGTASCDDPYTLVAIKGAASSPYVGGYFNAYHSLAAAEGRRDHPELVAEAELGPEGPATRAAGRNRTATAISLSRWAFGSADTVVIASRFDFVDALAAGSLAAALDAPLLLAGGDELGRLNALEVSRLGASEAWIIGGSSTLGAGVEEQLVEETSVTADAIRRIEGHDRYATAATIAAEVISRTDPTSAVLVSADDFVDALSGAALGASTGMPVLLTAGDRLPEATAEVLASHEWDGPMYLAGGPGTIGAAVEAAVGDAAWTDVERLAGGDRWETSVVMAEARARITGGEPSQVLVASGRDWPDSLAAGPATAARDAAFVIVDPRDLDVSAPTTRWLRDRSDLLVETRIAGAEGAVSDRVATQLAQAIATEDDPSDLELDRPTQAVHGEPVVQRLAGVDRETTATALARWGFERTDAVVVAARSDFPDALAAGALAGVLDAPLLLAGSGGLEAVNLHAIGRLGAREAWIVGGESAVPSTIESQLTESAGIPTRRITRLAGEDRYETAAAIAREVIARTDPDGAIVVSGEDYADALSASALGAATGLPVLLTRGDELPEATAEVLAGRSWDGPIYLAGGPATVSDQVAGAVATGAGTRLERIAGEDRYATSVAIGEVRDRLIESEPTGILIATGRDWPDALAAGPVAARRGAGFVIVHPEDLDRSSATVRWLDERAGGSDGIRVIGGPAAVSDEVAERIAEIAERIAEVRR